MTSLLILPKGDGSEEINRILLPDVTRIEIFGPGGHRFSGHFEAGTMLSLQDGTRTLKVFAEHPFVQAVASHRKDAS